MRRSFDANDKPGIVESRKQSVNQAITKVRKMRVVAGESNARFKFSIPVNHFVRFFLNCEIRHIGHFAGWQTPSFLSFETPYGVNLLWKMNREKGVFLILLTEGFVFISRKRGCFSEFFFIFAADIHSFKNN